ncbi:hypothetical protein G6514_009670 [Epicoccum nigrum]|nr:hypothetical protein G6514_009670 [Epicoccum nigrum]
MAAFTYSPLSRPDSLRLLKIHPDLDKATSHICIELQEATQDTPYRCLSYMWGDQTERLAVLVNGCLMLIGKSLYEFLEVARIKFAKEALWVDAVCINQTDNEEKSVQVQRMGRIYADALEVLIWLGHSPYIVEYFEWIHRSRTMKAQALNRQNIDPTPRTLKKPIIAFATHPYWKRAWVAQEVMLARSKRLLCCEAETDSSLLFPIKRVPTRRNNNDNNDNNEYVHATYELNRILDMLEDTRYLGKWQYSLWILTSRHGVARCQDPRDRLYSLLAIIGHATTFEVNYGEHLVELYWRAMEYFSAWSSQETMDHLWSLLSMERGFVEAYVRGKGQDLTILVPMHKARVRRRSWSARSVLFGAGQRYECANARRGFGCPVTRFSSRDILLCSRAGDGSDYDKVHLSVRRLKTESVSGFELHLHSLDWGRMLCPIDTEIWLVDGFTRQKLETWDDVASYAGGIALENDDWRDRPYLAVKLSQQYVFDCGDRYEYVIHVPKWRRNWT